MRTLLRCVVPSLILAIPLTHAGTLSADSASPRRTATHRLIASSVDQDNLIWSVTSLDSALALVGLGYNDKTRAVLGSFLENPVSKVAASHTLLNQEMEGLVVKSANNIWRQKGFEFRASYLDDVEEMFGGIEPGFLDYERAVETADEINQWAIDNTNGLIDEIVDEAQITPRLVMVLANALYFKGTWAEEFDPEMTTDEYFYRQSRRDPTKWTLDQTPLMNAYDRSVEVRVIREESDGDTVVVRLPYKGGEHSMYIAFAAQLPPELITGTLTPRVTTVNPRRDVEDVYRKQIVNGAAFSEEFASIEYDRFAMPKFTVKSTINDIEKTLTQGGYGDLFGPGALTRMSSDPRAYISKIMQKAIVIVNEEGTEAAAVTTMYGEVGGMMRPSEKLLINGPFAFAIRHDKSGMTLFEGFVRNPKAE